MTQTRIKQRFDVLSNWLSNDIVLLNGELAVVDCGEQIRFKVGDGTSKFSQLQFIDQNQLSTKHLVAEAISQGLHAKSVPYSLAAGAYLCADANFSQTFGFNSQTISTDSYAFAWNGDDSRAIGSPYQSHGKGTFNINSLSGVDGIYIGEQTLGDLLSDATGSKITIDDRVSSIFEERADLSIVKLNAGEYAQLVVTSATISNCLYIVEDIYKDAFGEQIKNVAAGTDLSDAVTLEQLSNAVSSIQIPSDLSSFTNSPGYLSSIETVAPTSSDSGKGKAADAKATGTALYTGFTEWVCDEISEGYTYNMCVWAMFPPIHRMIWICQFTKPNGDLGTIHFNDNFYAVSLSNSANPQISLSRHLITPTKTSQLSNDSGFLLAVPDTYALKSDVKMSYHSAERQIVLSAGSNQTSVDCNDFIKDGMLSSAELCGTQLVLNFNTDAGSNPISIELSNFVDDYDGKITDLSNKVHEAYITDGQNTISANLCCETNTVISQTWIVKSQYVGTYVLSTQSGYGYATYVPENPQPEDKRIELTLNEGSLWDPDRLYDFSIAVLYWRVVADGDGEADHYEWVNDSGGTTGLLPENATYYDDGLWQADFPYQVKQTKKLATTADLTAYQSAGNYLSSNALDNYYQKSETSSASEISNAIVLSAGNKIYIDDRISSMSGYSDLSIIRLSASEYENLPQEQRQLSNALYVVEDDNGDNHGKQIKNLAPGTDLSDAVNLEQLSNAVSSIQIPSDLSSFTNSPGYLVSDDISDYYTKSETSSASEIQSALDEKQPSGDYALTSQIPANVSQLSNDAGYLTEHQSLSNYYMKNETSSASEISDALSSKLSIVIKTANVSSTVSTLVINNVTQQEYLALSAAGHTVSSELYIIDPDSVNLDAKGDWVTNVKTPELSSDAANKAYVDSQLSNAGGGFSFEMYYPPYNSAAQTYVLKPGKFNILSSRVKNNDNIILEDYTVDQVYKVQLTGSNSSAVSVNLLVDTNAGDVLPGAYSDNSIASCLTKIAKGVVYNFEVSYGNVTFDNDFNGDSLRTLYPCGVNPVYGGGYEKYELILQNNTCNHLSILASETEYDNAPFDLIIPGRVRTNKVRRMRQFSVAFKTEFSERGMSLNFPSTDINGNSVKYTFICGSQYAKAPKQGDVLTFTEYQKDQLFVDIQNVNQNLWYSFVTPTPSNGIVTMKDRCVNYVNIKTTATSSWEWSDGENRAAPYYNEALDPPQWSNNGDNYEIINADAGQNETMLYIYPDPNDHDESTIVIGQLVTSYAVNSGNGTIAMPPAIPGKCRDFLLRIRIDADNVPNITFTGANFETESGVFPLLEKGVQVLSFTEVKVGTFMIGCKKLEVAT